ncbi:MAG: DNA-directed DNA polymerase epsilon, subunit B [Geoglossum simile]|nr:MAG: DNA-directed DNA polymerase epsilon, subunit B [Geoglossum simile]
MKNQRQRTAPLFRPSVSVDLNPVPSSSPAFGTPVHPIRTPTTTGAKPTILPVLLPAPTLRPVAFRTFTKKHNLTLNSTALQALATFIGKNCGAGWREEGLAERVLEEVAKTWKKLGGGVIVDGESDALKGILKGLEPCMSGGKVIQGSSSTLSRQSSFSFGAGEEGKTNAALGSIGLSREDSHVSLGVSGLELDDDEGLEDEGMVRDPRRWLKVVGAFDQPCLVYNVGKKHFEKTTSKPTLFPPAHHKTHLFRHRYTLIHQRLLRNDAFQPSSSSNAPQTTTTSYKITPITNLLGRSGTTHLLLGLLTISPTGTLAISDLTGSIALDLRHATPVPAEGAWFTPGMIVLVDGVYEEEYGGAGGQLGGGGGVGGTIGGRFVGFSVGGPPCERREVTLGIGSSNTSTSTTSSGGFGWVDFLGVGSERAIGPKMRHLSNAILLKSHPNRAKILILSSLHLNIPKAHDALRKILSIYEALPPTSQPLAIVLIGSFVSHAAMAGGGCGGGSIEYKEYWDLLAGTLTEFPTLIVNSTFIFVPGDNDPWASSFAAGASTTIPRHPIPELFTTRVRRVFASAKAEAAADGPALGGGGQAIFTTNPTRLTLFGPVKELVIFRDDIVSRLRRSAITFRKPPSSDAAAPPDSMDLDPPDAPSHTLPRTLTKTLLDQSHLSPFPLSTRPVLWDHAASLSLYPLPSALILAVDAETAPFSVTYEGCCVVNPGAVLAQEGPRRLARWCEFDVMAGRGMGRDVAF